MFRKISIFFKYSPLLIKLIKIKKVPMFTIGTFDMFN